MPNSTIETTGWAPEPQGRGTIGLLWNCFATIFLCTWSAIHPNLPRIGEIEIIIFLRRVGYLLGALVVPEFFVIAAIEELSIAMKARKNLGCTLKQAFFIYMGGVAINDVSENDNKPVRIKFASLIRLIEDGKMVLPALGSADKDDRSKSDWIVKSFASIQILSFVVQIISRAVNQMSVTTLELFTLANVCCGAVMYIAWWKKPFDIRTPIIVEISERLQDGDRIERVTFDNSSDKYQRFHSAVAALCFGLFGGLHIIGWGFYFSSEAELWLWRASSIICTLMPFAVMMSMEWLFPEEKYPIVWKIMLSTWAALYLMARLYMLVEMFVGLRSVPKDVYQTVEWTQYFPALG
ncbi:hypothetical protein NX059_002103 [Plenodomus lindquistii]|nr:hypothetical protein NX059_002103 [Plenodomus lindquistii]